MDSGKTYIRALDHTKLTCKPLAYFVDYMGRYDKTGTAVWIRDVREYAQGATLKETAPDTFGEGTYQAVCRWYGYLIGQ